MAAIASPFAPPPALGAPMLSSSGLGFPRPPAPAHVQPRATSPTGMYMPGSASAPCLTPLSAMPSQHFSAMPQAQVQNGYPQQRHRSTTPQKITPREGKDPSLQHRSPSPAPLPQVGDTFARQFSKPNLQMPASQDVITGPALANASSALENAEEHRSLSQAHMSSKIQSHLRHTGHSSHKRPSVHSPHGHEWIDNDPHGASPVTLRSMHAAVQSLRREPSTRLPAAFVGRVLTDAENTLRRYRSAAVQHISLQSSARLVVVGDTHGQLADVLWIFHKHGLPSRSVMYLFNGDVADRGSNAIEIFVLILGFMAAAPEIMYMNRGNHEDDALNHGPVGGFYDECLQKYGREIGGVIFSKMARIYALLPIATVIGQSVFVVHGGLYRGKHFLHTLETLHDRRSTIPTDTRDARDQALVDALWSDPSEQPGLTPSARGSSLVQFGPDITQNFLRETGFSLVLRSHEVPPNLDGVYYMHGNRCLTLFSASNYCGSTGNQGAVLVFSERMGQLAYDVSRHFAPDLNSGAFRKHAEQAVQNPADFETANNQEEVAAVRAAVSRDPTNSRLHQDVLGQIARLMVEHKAALWSFFFRHDTQKTGFVAIDVWLRGCHAIVGNFHWEMLEKLLAVENQGQVDYFAFLQRFRVALMGDEVSDNWAEVLLAKVYQRLLHKEASFREYMRVFDRDGDGVVTIQELHQAFAELDVGITQQQAAALMRTISSHASSVAKGGQPGSSIDINSFLARFEMVYHPLAENRNVPAWVAAAMARIGRHLWVGKFPDNCTPEERTRHFFEGADKNGDGILSYREFSAGLHRFMRQTGDAKLDLTEAQITELAQWIDVSRQGSINYLEFLASFTPNDYTNGQAFQVDLMEHICTLVWCNKPALFSALLTVDVQHTGEVTREQMIAALRALNHSLDPESSPLTDEQIQLLVEHTKFDPKSGRMRYKRFLDSFQVFDTASTQR